jgi:glycosyltransferase involved in cell wall biosynthesis
MDHTKIRSIMQGYHYLLHPATRDACPNVILEALSAGLPVIFNPQPGSSAELVQNAGIALNEDNLTATADLARSEINICRAHALHQREKFRLDFAVSQYADAFKQLLKISGS